VANVETTLTVATDRRVYYFRLIATSRDHTARIAFSYPDDERRRKEVEEEAGRARAVEAAKLATLAASKEIKNWKYNVEQHGKDAHYMLPLSVGDDGARTYIQLSQEVRKLGLPTLSITGATGEIPANSHWEDNRLIVDALFDHGCLLEGVGKQQQRICITNEGSK
jgi:type IV secretory pathway VirB9-like protein